MKELGGPSTGNYRHFLDGENSIMQTTTHARCAQTSRLSEVQVGEEVVDVGEPWSAWRQTPLTLAVRLNVSYPAPPLPASATHEET